MITIDEQIQNLLKPILAEAKAINCNISGIGLIYDEKPDARGIYFNFHGESVYSSSGYGVDGAAKVVKPYDPRAEKLAAIEKLKAELAALETPETKEN
jgi:hypothetical protein